MHFWLYIIATVIWSVSALNASLPQRCPGGGAPGYLPHESDCSSFYTCQNGERILKKCPANLHFNRQSFVCDYPQYAGCSESKGSTLSDRGKSNNELDHISCSAEDNPRLQVSLPHPSECEKYFLCSNGIPHAKVCPKGLHFSYVLQRCDYPENVGCDTGSYKPPKIKTGRENRVDECPLENVGMPKLLPHATDCGKFYICDSGIPHLKTCQQGLHFNSKLQICDYSDRAGCDKNHPKEPDAKKEKENLKQTECPSKTTGQPTLLPHSSDCGKFYICDNGVQHLKSCQQGLHFNNKLQVCDYPEKAGCVERLSSTIHQQKGPGIPSPFCPSISPEDPVFYIHPYNCSIYYLCDHGLAYEFVCPARLHFNLKKKYCDYEWLARCEEDYELENTTTE